MSSRAMPLGHVFPPPRYMKMPATGIDISDDAVRFVGLKQTRHGLVFDTFGEQKLPEGVISSGKVRDTQKLAGVLQEIGTQLETDFATVSIPEEKAYIVRLKLPRMKRSEIRGSLELQFEEQIPISVSDAVFDYTVADINEKEIEVTLSAFPREEIEEMQNVFAQTSITPIGFEVESEALVRSVVPAGDTGTYLIVDFERAKTSVSIVSNGVIRFTASINIGTSALIDVIEKNENVSREKAEQLLKEKGVASDNEDEHFFANLLPTFATLRDEINKHFIYWHSHEDQYGNARPEIEKIILCGAGGSLSGLADYLSSGLRTTVEHARIINNMNSIEQYVPEMEYTETFKYATAIGLALAYPK